MICDSAADFGSAPAGRSFRILAQPVVRADAFSEVSMDDKLKESGSAANQSSVQPEHSQRSEALRLNGLLRRRPRVGLFDGRLGSPTFEGGSGDDSGGNIGQDQNTEDGNDEH